MENSFKYPDHPLVKKYAAQLSAIQTAIAELLPYLEEDGEDATAAPRLYTPEQLQAYEQQHQLTLPDSLKALLMEIGELGEPYFDYSFIGLPTTAAEIKRLQKTSPLTQQSTYFIKSRKCRAFLYNESFSYAQAQDEIPKTVSFSELPVGFNPKDGCLVLGTSGCDDADVCLIGNGEFAGEVWIDYYDYNQEPYSNFSPPFEGPKDLLGLVAYALNIYPKDMCERVLG